MITNSKIGDKDDEKFAKYQPLKELYSHPIIAVINHVMGTLRLIEDHIISDLPRLPGYITLTARNLAWRMQPTVAQKSAKILKKALNFK